MYVHACERKYYISMTNLVSSQEARYVMQEGRKKNCANRGTENFRKIVVGDVERIKKGRG